MTAHFLDRFQHKLEEEIIRQRRFTDIRLDAIHTRPSKSVQISTDSRDTCVHSVLCCYPIGNERVVIEFRFEFVVTALASVTLSLNHLLIDKGNILVTLLLWLNGGRSLVRRRPWLRQKRRSVDRNQQFGNYQFLVVVRRTDASYNLIDDERGKV